MENSESTNPKSEPSTKRGRRPRMKAQGLGDTIEQITEATGIKKLVDWFSEATGVDCGCEARKQKLNQLLSYSRIECLTKDEYEWLSNLFSLKPRSLSVAQQDVIARTHARVFNHTLHKPCNCSPREWQRYVDDLRKVWSEYNAEEQNQLIGSED